MPYRYAPPSRIAAKRLHRLLLPALAVWMTGVAATEYPLPITNLVIGGGERRCSSFNGSAQGGDCLADWDTILAQDPAFVGIRKERISFDAQPGTPVFHYSLTPASLEAIRSLPAALFDPNKKREVLAHFARRLHDPVALRGLTWQAFELLLPGPLRQGEDALSLAETAVLRSAVLDRAPSEPRKMQGRSTLFSSNVASVAITQRFVDAARAVNGGKKPLIGVVTASADAHPFADRDINMFALASAGADVVYLPLEGGFRQALDAQDCDNVRYYYDHYANTNPSLPVYHADVLFPDLSAQQQLFCINNAQLLNDTLERINGIYFSGGDQARHVDSLIGKDSNGHYTVVSEQLKIIRRRHAQGQLVVAGTSAGNHFQGGGQWHGKPVPMVGGGDSYDVLKNGFAIGKGPTAAELVNGRPGSNLAYAPVLYPLGGLGVFDFGVLDSHFSKRTREARLVRAVVDSGMDYGFGVDENTALLVSARDAKGSTHFSVLGAGGVFMVDVRQAKAGTDPRMHFVIQGARAHYLLPGDMASINLQGDLQVVLDTKHPVLPVAHRAARVTQNRLLDYGSHHFLHLTHAMGLQGAACGFGTTRDSADPRTTQTTPFYSATLVRDGLTVFRGHAPAGLTEPDRVSYTGLILGLAPCEGDCQDAGSALQAAQSRETRNGTETCLP